MFSACTLKTNNNANAKIIRFTGGGCPHRTPPFTRRYATDKTSTNDYEHRTHEKARHSSHPFALSPVGGSRWTDCGVSHFPSTEWMVLKKKKNSVNEKNKICRMASGKIKKMDDFLRHSKKHHAYVFGDVDSK